MRDGLLLVLALTLTGSEVRADSPKKDEAADLVRWIRQLGSNRHRERESAVTALARQRSPQALALLRQAATTGDFDTRKRARDILSSIERTLEMAQFLVPEPIRLDFKDVLVTDAVTDFIRRTGIKLTIAEKDKTRLSNRRVSFDTGEVGYWEALQQLCQKAGLVEEMQSPVLEIDDFEEMRWRRRRIMWMHRDQVRTPSRPEFTLVESRTQRPTFNAGALRIQAVPPTFQVGPPAPGETTLILAVDLEPRFNWSRLVSVRIDWAIDGLGQDLVQPSLFVGNLPAQPQAVDEMFIVWDGSELDPRQSSPRHGEVKLKRGLKVSRTLKEVRGIVSAEVETPTVPLVIVGDVLKSGGQTFRGADGASVRVLEMTADEDQYRVKIEVKLPPKPNPQLVVGRALWMAVPGAPAAGTVNITGAEAEQKGLALYDDQGQPFLLATGSYQKTDRPDAPVIYTLFYQPRKEQGAPAKFVFSGRRMVLLEVPFTLKNVSLP